MGWNLSRSNSGWAGSMSARTLLYRAAARQSTARRAADARAQRVTRAWLYGVGSFQLERPSICMNSEDHAEALNIEDVSVRFGGITALDGVSFRVMRGQICAVIGPNGAGKSTLFNCISRLYTSNSGRITFEGKDLFSLPRRRMASVGIGRTFQNLALFRTLTVEENIMVGTHSVTHAGFLSSALGLPAANKAEAAAKAKADHLLEFLDLRDVAHRSVGDLPFGIQKRVEMGRALASEPRLLLLDEPACGLNHEELNGLSRLIVHVRDALKITILLVEHHMSLVMDISNHVVALNFGKKIGEGTPTQVARNEQVVAAYLGSE